MNSKKKLLISYDWFYPGFRAGGPIQSLTNLTIALIPDYEIFVITGSRDLNSTKSYSSIIVNRWNDVYLPGNQKAIKVFYADKKTLNKSTYNNLIEQIKPSIVYLNGIFSYVFFLLPLLCLKRNNTVKVVVCPRGMLKKGALSSKAFKKKIYINYLKLSGLLKMVSWHATTPEERADVKQHFPRNDGVLVAANIPRRPLANFSFISKQPGELKLVYLSLINPHKNLLLLLKILRELESKVSLDVYGPVVDELYWAGCVDFLKQMPATVQYKGAVEPAMVQEVLSNYHALILLTKGENFGHAIYESLSVGRPVITTHFTPWQQLHEQHAGVNVSLEQEDCTKKINAFIQMDQEEYNMYCSGAHAVAANYYKNLNAANSYKELFM